MVVRDVCPRCQSPKSKTNGHLHHGKQHHQCHDCGRQLVDGSAQYLLAEDTRALSERLLVERLAVRGIGRAVGVPRKWVVGFLVQGVEALPDHLTVEPVRRTQDGVIQRLEVEADDRQSVVKKQAHKPWMWLAMAAKTRQVIAFHGGDRSRRRATR
jgi:insertion element IS1 protein InsB